MFLQGAYFVFAVLEQLTQAQGAERDAFDVLCAELGNVMICALLGLTPDLGQSAAYCGSSLRALKEDKRMIF